MTLRQIALPRRWFDRARPARARGAIARQARRYWQALQRAGVARIAVLSAALLVVGAAGVYIAEQGDPEAGITSFGEGLWYTIVTMATVGYGDYTPKTVAGRFIGVVLIFVGLILVAVFTATISSTLVAQKLKEARGLEAIQLRNHLLVCGWNERAERVLEGLQASTNDQHAVVLVNELPEETVNEILYRFRESEVRYVRGDPAAETVLERANVRQARAAIVLADASRGYTAVSDERTTLVTLAIKSLKPEMKVTAEAIDGKSETHLRRAGADDVVISGEFNGFLLSSAALAPGLSEVARQLLSRSGNELRRQPIPAEFVGKTFAELLQGLRSRTGFLTLAIVTESRGLKLDDLLTDDYSLIDEFIKQQFSEAGTDYTRFESAGMRVTVNPSDSYLVGRDDEAIGIPRDV